jgi:predicted RNA binding protein YcfA (HicA-like mRNA interferase family)
MNGITLLRKLHRLATRRGWQITTRPGKGAHVVVTLNGKRTVVSQHRDDLAKGTFRTILKQLEITEDDLED